METTALRKFYLKDPGSAITHFIGMLLAILAAWPLLLKASQTSGHLLPVLIFSTSMILLYAASTTYHTFNLTERGNVILKKIDHMMIFILIAGTYTPVCLITLRDGIGPFMCALVWGIALGGMLIKAFWIYCPKWFSSVLYIGMGWVCIMGLSQILTALPPAGFAWLLAGGIIYTIGGIIYALKLPLFNSRHQAFGSHEIFHLFVMGGSLCHFIVIYGFVA